jgi:hypothetical protein
MSRFVASFFAAGTACIALLAGCAVDSSADQGDEPSADTEAAVSNACVGTGRLSQCDPPESLWCKDRRRTLAPVEARCEQLCGGGDAVPTLSKAVTQSETWITVKCQCISMGNKTRTTRCFDES